MAVHKCCTFRFKTEKYLIAHPDACCALLALRSIQPMTGEPRPRYSALQLLGVSGACAANGSSTLSQQQRHPVVYGRMPQQGRAVLPSGRHSHGQRDHHRRAGPQQARHTADYRPASQTPTARNTVPPSHMRHPQHQSSQPSYRQYPHRAPGVTYAHAAQKSKIDPGLCIYCGEDNHRHGSCRYGRPITCFICNTDGHKAKFCSYQ